MSKTLAIASGDWFVNPVGQGEMIHDRDKAVQDLGMHLMCDKYGGLNRLVGRGAASKAVVSMAIHDSVQRLQSAQTNDPKTTAGERVVSIQNLEIAVNNRDAFFVLDVNTGDKGSVTVADGLRYRLPQPGVSSGYTQTQLNDLVTTKIV